MNNRSEDIERTLRWAHTSFINDRMTVIGAIHTYCNNSGAQWILNRRDNVVFSDADITDCDRVIFQTLDEMHCAATPDSGEMICY